MNCSVQHSKDWLKSSNLTRDVSIDQNTNIENIQRITGQADWNVPIMWPTHFLLERNAYMGRLKNSFVSKKKGKEKWCLEKPKALTVQEFTAQAALPGLKRRPVLARSWVAFLDISTLCSHCILRWVVIP